jgi:hypothetical protein
VLFVDRRLAEEIIEKNLYRSKIFLAILKVLYYTI